ncbi:MAG: Ig-like domain-containing protein [Acutalibacteraceae bacterium]|nr:Ig-like domain-containing protein [Acutalibacteraceae bacterium]
MKFIDNIKTLFSEKNKKAITIFFTTIAVTVVSFTAGAVVIGTGIVSREASSDKLSANSTAKSSSVKKADTDTNELLKASENINDTENKNSLKLAKNKVAIIKGESYYVEFAEGINKEKFNLKWSTSDKSVATVNEKGIVKGIAKGKCEIVCTNIDDNSTVKLTITVSEPVYPDNITLDKEIYTLTSIGQPLKLNATLVPNDDTVTETKLTWSSDNESVATVKDGLVTATGEGVAVITCTTVNDITAQCVVTVTPVVKAEEIYLDYIGYDFDGPQTQSVPLTATVYPDNTTNSAVSWHSTDENVAVVDAEGNITAVGDGECEIICTTTDGTYLSASCEIKATNTMAVTTHTPGTSVYVPVNPVPADTVLEEALRYVGVIPYVWGGTDLSSGVDCSGFICAVYSRFGIDLWGLRTDLYLAGVEVPSIEEAKAGDILCYPGHVAIYDGNGGRVHAYDEGYMILRDTNIDGYYTIRRIIE